MAKCDYTELANLCKTTITNPSTLSTLKPFLNSHDPIVLLSLFKVFKNIIPLYKINIKEDTVKHKQSYIKLKSSEKVIYNLYKIYIERVKKSKQKVSFQIASMLMLELDHFNFAEKMINKVLEGTKTEKYCVDAVLQKTGEDEKGDSTFKIMLALMEFNLCDAVYECITKVNVVDKLTIEDYENTKTEKNIEKKDKNIKMLMNNKYAKGIEKSSLKSRKDKKDDVKNNKLTAKLLIEKEKKKEDDTVVIQRKIVDNLMRIYFMILNENRTKLYKYCFKGLPRYKRFIKNIHMNGLMMLLNNVLKNSDHVNRIQACMCIIEIFGEHKFEFRNIMDVVFEIMIPLRYDLSLVDKKILMEILGFLFIKNKQSNGVVCIFVQRILQFVTTFYLPELETLLTKIINFYKLDLYDFEIVKNGVYEIECDRIDFVRNHPLYLGPFFIEKQGDQKLW